MHKFSFFDRHGKKLHTYEELPHHDPDKRHTEDLITEMYNYKKTACLKELSSRKPSNRSYMNVTYF